MPTVFRLKSNPLGRKLSSVKKKIDGEKSQDKTPEN